MVQILPADNAFDYGTVADASGNHFGIHQSLYFGCRMGAISWLPGLLHDGWSTVANQAGFEGRMAVAAPTTTGADRFQRRGFLPSHPVFDEAAEASGTFQYFAPINAAFHTTYGAAGLMVRVKDPVGVDNLGTMAYGWRNCYGYGLEIFSAPGGQAGILSLTLRRYVAGTESIINSATPMVGIPGIGIPSINAPITVTLKAETIGSRVDITYTITGGGLGQTYTFVHSDTDADRILGDGRAGFYMYCARQDTSVGADPIIANGITTFQVREASTTVWRDEFRRTNPLASYQTDSQSNLAGFFLEGSSLQSAWYWDNFTAWPGHGPNEQGATIGVSGRRFLRNQSFEAGLVTSQNESTIALPIISQRPAGDERSQHRSAALTMINTPSSGKSYESGIILRATQPVATAFGGTPALDGYAMVCNAGNTTVNWQLRRYRNGSSAIIGSLTEPYSSLTYLPGIGSAFTLGFEVYPIGDPLDGAAGMTVKVDGVLLPLTPAGSGVTSPSSGVIQDASSNRIKQGFGEGLWFGATSVGGSDYRVRYDTWSEGGLTNTLGSIPEDQASESVYAEDALYGRNPFGDLHDRLAPDFPFVQEIIGEPVQHEMESGAFKSYARAVKADGTAKPRRRWRFFKQNATAAEYSSLMTFYKSRESGEWAFNWEPIVGGTSYVCCFMDDALESLLRFKDTRSLAFSVIEVG